MSNIQPSSRPNSELSEVVSEGNDNQTESIVHGSLSENVPQPSKQKIDILLKPTGNAPIMKKQRWAVPADRKIAGIIDFIRKYLKLEPTESLFLYINQSFAPAPDNIIRNLYECYGIDGKLIIHYCKSQAWG